MRRIAPIALMLLVAGCTKVGTTSEPGGEARQNAFTQPHVLRLATGEDIVGLNPMISTQGVVSYLSSMTMAWLVKTDAHANPTVPELATEVPTQANGGISRDGKTITWHLRRGVKWSDGAPFDGDDVVFSTQQVLNPANNVISRDGWDQIIKIDEPDKFTVVYHLKAPYSSYLVTFFSSAGANPAIMPKHLLKQYPNLNNVPYNSLPIGIGPFKYESWKRSDSIVLVPNPLYFRGLPKLQKIINKIIPDRNTVLQEVRSHEVDLWTPVSPHFYPELKAIPGITISMTPSFFFDHIDFNNQRPALRDPAVRQAMRFGIDRDTLNKKVRNGLYILTDSVVPPASTYHDASIPLVPFDIARGNALLDRAGWRRGADGVRAKGGVRLALEYATSSGTPDSDTQIELERSWWKQMGIEITVKHYPAPLMFAPAQQGGIMYGGKFDLVGFAWGGDPNQDLSNLYACYRFPPNGQNDPRYCNTAVTAAMDKAKTTYDPAARRPYLNFIQQQMVKDSPIVVLDARKEIYAYNSDLKNWHPNPVAPFDDMLGVDI